ncbi:MAG: rhomboid family intramembrane serine protease [Ardenticatenaceae bacterium]|nr:rhomboid family intramembrane serine protease [Ardenticatenaceae bacterium]HBY93648.1 hypothetical protein [Chloroflexota bacterium]
MDDDRPPSADVGPTWPPARPQQRGYPLPIHRAWITFTVLVLNFLVFMAMEVAGGSTSSCVLLRFGAKFNYLIAQGQWWRLLTPIFLHIGMVHLLFNEYALWLFGREVERLFGSARFILIYILSGLYGSWASFAFSPALSAGASGAIFGIIGALVAFFLRNRQRFGELGRRQLTNLVVVIGLNLVLGFTIPGIDNFGHIGGLTSGFLLGLALTPLYTLEPDFHLALGARVVDRNSLTRSAWAVALGVLLLLLLLQVGLAITPIDRLDAARAANCL